MGWPDCYTLVQIHTPIVILAFCHVMLLCFCAVFCFVLLYGFAGFILTIISELSPSFLYLPCSSVFWKSWCLNPARMWIMPQLTTLEPKWRECDMTSVTRSPDVMVFQPHLAAWTQKYQPPVRKQLVAVLMACLFRKLQCYRPHFWDKVSISRQGPTSQPVNYPAGGSWVLMAPLNCKRHQTSAQTI